MKKKLYVVIHNVRSAYNVGSVFRTSDGAGVEKIYLTGYTPAPYDPQKEIYPTTAQNRLSKTALGAEKNVSWEKIKNINTAISKLRKENFSILSLEKTDASVDIEKFKPEFPCALILGNEVRGISKNLREKSDAIISIPMRGKKESLNVSVAAGIAIYHLL
jgi:tRNA G18 (ribose-2'-O)-methylase SpoU